MTLAEGQMEWRGLLLGVDTDYWLRGVEGLRGHTVRVGDRDLPRGDGSVPGDHYATAKTPIVDVAVTGATEDALHANLATLRTAARGRRTVDERLRFRMPGEPVLFVWARVVDAVERLDGRSATVARHTIGFRCADPRVYADAEKMVHVPVYESSGGGVEGPVDGAKDSTGGGQTEAVAQVAGDSDAYPLIRWHGPTDGGTVTGVTLTNRTNGSEITIDTSVSVDQILTARMRHYVTGLLDTRIVDLDGASRYGDWTSRPDAFWLSPGDNVLRFTVTGTSTDVACVVAWRDTWDGTIR